MKKDILKITNSEGVVIYEGLVEDCPYTIGDTDKWTYTGSSTMNVNVLEKLQTVNKGLEIATDSLKHMEEMVRGTGAALRGLIKSVDFEAPVEKVGRRGKSSRCPSIKDRFKKRRKR